MIHGLENLKEEVRQKQLRDFALAIVKYQNFKTKAALAHISYNSSKTTTENYFGCGVRYIKSNRKVKHNNIPLKIYDYIDEFLEQHVQPLTPSIKDTRSEYKVRKNIYHGKNSVPPVAKLQIVKQQITEKYDMYGIKLPNGHIIPCKNEDYSAGYFAALRDSNVDTTDYKTILLKISEV